MKPTIAISESKWILLLHSFSQAFIIGRKSGLKNRDGGEIDGQRNVLYVCDCKGC